MDSSKYERKVRKLQVRIAKVQRKEVQQGKGTLRYLLATSYEAKALAIRKVTSNKGKRTAGVDHMKWDTDAKKIEAICLLKRRGYKVPSR
ncbi:reverse transcriptase N-terminal domain-containing protein [Bacteroides ovatus]|nr:reverse transcriptase N-terminal domain-containing protein [Bacteroides ovatus]